MIRSHAFSRALFLLIFCIFPVTYLLFGCGVRAEGTGTELEPGQNESAVAKLCETMGVTPDEAEDILALLSETGFPGDVRYVRKWADADGAGEYYRVRSSDGEKRDVYLEGGKAVKITDGKTVLYESGKLSPEVTSADSSGNAAETDGEEVSDGTAGQIEIILNTNTKKYHYPGCRYVASIKDGNRKTVYVSDVSELSDMGYSPCGVCAKADAES